MSREWSQSEIDLARKIVVCVETAGQLLGTKQVVRGVGLPFGRDKINSSVDAVQDVMPLAVKLSRDMYPSRVLMVNRDDHVYRMIDSVDRAASNTIRARARKVLTAEARVVDELSVAQDPLHQALGHLFKAKMTMNEGIADFLAQVEASEQQTAD